ncbi:D-alanyl-D-alanine carboxypeptidase [Candidatus Puniceispirillum sp.]|nr:D-alanyl-D-alanine carboxypeptidase [Candidatus Puniceispirillum sp.]
MLILDAGKPLHNMPPNANKSTCHGIKLLFQIFVAPLLTALISARTIFLLKLIAAGVMLFLYFGFSPTPALANKYAAIVIEEISGKVLFSRNADHLRYPASLTKIMTLYLLFEDIEAGRITLNSLIPVSRKAAGRSPSKLYLKPGQSISAEQAIFALVTKSANDVATAIAEKLSSTERKFAQRMTRKARALGMRRTTFKNASGLPNRQQKSTARDMAKLAVAMRRDFPQFYKYFSTQNFSWKGRKYGNHNKLLSKYRGTDGIKTGYINASGFNLVATVERKGIRLIGVVFGGKTSRSRDRHMMKILDNQFKRIKTITVRRAALDLPTTLPMASPKRSQKRYKSLPTKKTTTYQKSVKQQDEFINLDVTGLTGADIISTTSWSVQIGNFAQRVNAHRAAIIARRMADEVLGMTPANLSLVNHGEMPLWRVRFNNLDEDQARTACAALFSAGQRCIALAVPNISRG